MCLVFFVDFDEKFQKITAATSENALFFDEF